VTLSYLTKPD